MTQQEVAAKIKGKALSVFTQSYLDNLNKKSAAFIREMIIKRILDGKDLYGNSFGGYAKSYNKKKAWQYAAAKYGTFKYSSSSTADKLRLTGRLLSKIKVEVKGAKKFTNQITFSYLITTDPIVKDQVEGLQSTVGVARNKKRYAKKAWYFLGISKQLGEQDKLKNYLIKALQGGIGSVTTKDK